MLVKYTPYRNTCVVINMENSDFLELQTAKIDFAKNIYQSYDHVLFRPSVNDVSAVDNIIIEAKIGSDRYTDLSKAYVELVCQLTTTGDAAFALPTTESAHLTNGWAAFNDIKLELEGTQVEYVLNPGIVANMANIKSKSLGNLKIAESEGYYPIIARDIGTNALLVASDGWTRASAYQNQTRGGINKQFTIQLKLQDVFGFCSVPKVIRGGMYTLRLNKANNWGDMLVKATAGADAKLKINRAELWLPSITFNEELNLALARLQTAQTPVHFDFSRSYTSRTSQTGSGNVIQVQSGVSNPRMILVGMKATTSSNNYATSTFNYQNPDMARLYARVNGKILPLQPFEKNSATNQSLRGYFEFLKVDGKAFNENLDSVMTYEEWNASNCIWVLDVSLYNETFSSISGPATIQIDYQLDSAANLDVDIVVLSDSHIKLTELGGRVQVVEA